MFILECLHLPSIISCIYDEILNQNNALDFMITQACLNLDNSIWNKYKKKKKKKIGDVPCSKWLGYLEDDNAARWFWRETPPSGCKIKIKALSYNILENFCS